MKPGLSGAESSGLADVVSETRAGPVVRIRVTPRSSRRGVGVGPGWLTVGVGSPAERGRATEEALRALADWLGLARSRLDLVGGASSRAKRVLVSGETPSGLRKRIAERVASGR